MNPLEDPDADDTPESQRPTSRPPPQFPPPPALPTFTSPPVPGRLLGILQWWRKR